LSPARRPQLLIGGNGDRVLQLAASVADIVGFTGLGRTLPDGQRHVTEWERSEIDAKVEVVRGALATRLETLGAVEMNALVQHVEITTDRRAAAERVAARIEMDPEVLLDAPYMLIGTVGEIVDQLHRARKRWGFSYFVTRDSGQTAPIIAALRG
jgi:alkanesulfonate monooxygenase SsuD/methylene tetrahydromethanopterin reductase-like flavin-dependent oxidoreductase (luciferase family)